MFDDAAAAVVHEMNQMLVNMHKNTHDMKAFTRKYPVNHTHARARARVCVCFLHFHHYKYLNRLLLK